MDIPVERTMVVHEMVVLVDLSRWNSVKLSRKFPIIFLNEERVLVTYFTIGRNLFIG